MQSLVAQNASLVKQMERMEANQVEILNTQRAVLALLQRGTSVMPTDNTDTTSGTSELFDMPLSSTATLAVAPLLPADMPPVICPTTPTALPAPNVCATRPVSFLPPPPILHAYDVGLGSVDIGELFHRAFRVGTTVTHKKKQERGRLKAVVQFAENLLLNSSNTAVRSIAARLNMAPVSQSSVQWPEWSRSHREACAELKDVVVGIVSAHGPKLQSTSVSSIGSRIALIPAGELPAGPVGELPAGEVV